MTTRVTVHLDCDISIFNLLSLRLAQVHRLAVCLVVTSRAFPFGGGQACVGLCAGVPRRPGLPFSALALSILQHLLPFVGRHTGQHVQLAALSGATAVSWTSISAAIVIGPFRVLAAFHRHQSRSFLGFWCCRGWGGTVRKLVPTYQTPVCLTTTWNSNLAILTACSGFEWRGLPTHQCSVQIAYNLSEEGLHILIRRQGALKSAVIHSVEHRVQSVEASEEALGAGWSCGLPAVFPRLVLQQRVGDEGFFSNQKCHVLRFCNRLTIIAGIVKVSCNLLALARPKTEPAHFAVRFGSAARRKLDVQKTAKQLADF